MIGGGVAVELSRRVVAVEMPALPPGPLPP